MRRPALLAFACVLGAALFTAGCEPQAAPRSPLNYSADAKRAYDGAMAEFQAHNWIDAQELFRDVKRRFSYTKWARLAELRIADADFEQDKFPEALRQYKQFIHDHKSDAEEVEYARARAAEAQYREISDALFLPAQEERDQAAALDSYKDLNQFLRDYPASKQNARVCGLLEDVTARLVRHELSVARFYLQRDNFDAAVLRAQYAIRTYGGSDACDKVPNIEHLRPEQEFGMVPEAMLLLGETYLKMRRDSDASAAFQALLGRFPQSTLGEQARGYLDEIARRKTKGT
jgi:outer membrane protein assembly factor BamD